MGITVVLPNMTLTQLADEGPERWPEIWSTNQSRIRILMLCRRNERQLMEVHGDMIDHNHPVFGLFHRPRETSELLIEQDFDPRSASFQFLDIATTDLGKWVQHLITNDGWTRSMTEILPVPKHMQIGMTRAFEGYSMPCFRHPDLPTLERLHLPMPAESLVGKAFVSIPRLGAEDLATRRGAEILVQSGTEVINPEIEMPAPVVDNVPIPIAEVTTGSNDIVDVSTPEVPITHDSREQGIEVMSSTLSELASNQAENPEKDESELIDGFSEELLASVTHSANEEQTSPPTVESSDSISEPVPPPTDVDGSSDEETETKQTEDEVGPEIKLVFPELDSDFLGSDRSNNEEVSKKSSHPTKPPSGPPTKPPSGPPTKPPSGPPTKPPSSPPTKPPSSPPTKPPSSPPTKPPSETGPPSSAPPVIESPEGDFRKIVSDLLAGGTPANEITDHAEFQQVSEVAIAAGVDTWSIFLEISGAA